jgi:hypothetical protein
MASPEAPYRGARPVYLSGPPSLKKFNGGDTDDPAVELMLGRVSVSGPLVGSPLCCQCYILRVSF